MPQGSYLQGKQPVQWESKCVDCRWVLHHQLLCLHVFCFCLYSHNVFVENSLRPSVCRHLSSTTHKKINLHNTGWLENVYCAGVSNRTFKFCVRNSNKELTKNKRKGNIYRRKEYSKQENCRISASVIRHYHDQPTRKRRVDKLSKNKWKRLTKMY